MRHHGHIHFVHSHVVAHVHEIDVCFEDVFPGGAGGGEGVVDVADNLGLQRSKLRKVRKKRRGGGRWGLGSVGRAYGLFLDAAWDDDIAAVGYGDGAAGEHYALVRISTGRYLNISVRVTGRVRAGIRTNEFILQADVCDYGLLSSFRSRGRDNGGRGNEQAGEEGSEGAHLANIC